MPNFTQIIKEFATFLGKKLDALIPRDKIKVDLEGVSVVTIKGDKGEPGQDGKSIVGPAGPAGKDGKSVAGPRGLPGKDGKDSKVPGPQGPEGESITGPKGPPGKDGSPDTGEQIIAKINKDKSDKIIRKEKVEGLQEIENMARTADANSRYGLRAAGDTVYLADLSTQTNGVTKQFTVPIHRRAIMVMGSDFPTVLFSGNGFTDAAATITLTTDNAPSEGSQLGYLYVI